jgi:hypothetical protein
MIQLKLRIIKWWNETLCCTMLCIHDTLIHKVIYIDELVHGWGSKEKKKIFFVSLVFTDNNHTRQI